MFFDDDLVSIFDVERANNRDSIVLNVKEHHPVDAGIFDDVAAMGRGALYGFIGGVVVLNLTVAFLGGMPSFDEAAADDSF